MKTNDQEYSYVLHDTQNYQPTDLKGRSCALPAKMTEAQAQTMNYARGLNNSPLRWIQGTIETVITTNNT